MARYIGIAKIINSDVNSIIITDTAKIGRIDERSTIIAQFRYKGIDPAFQGIIS